MPRKKHEGRPFSFFQQALTGDNGVPVGAYIPDGEAWEPIIDIACDPVHAARLLAGDLQQRYTAKPETKWARRRCEHSATHFLGWSETKGTVIVGCVFCTQLFAWSQRVGRYQKLQDFRDAPVPFPGEEKLVEFFQSLKYGTPQIISAQAFTKLREIIGQEVLIKTVDELISSD